MEETKTAPKERHTNRKPESMLIYEVAAEFTNDGCDSTAEVIRVREGSRISLQIVGPATILIVRHRDMEVRRCAKSGNRNFYE